MGVKTRKLGNINNSLVEWQSKVTSDGSTVTTMVAGRGYFVDNTSAAGFVKLPASATAGDTIAIKDYAGNFGTNNLTIQRNGHNIQGVTNDSLLQTNKASVILVYIDSTKGWLFTNESNVGDLENKGFTAATGGSVSTVGDYKYHVFTGDGCFVVSTAGFGVCSCVPAGLDTVQALVVAGGGGASGNGGGGAGAGGLRNVSGMPISVQTYPITVGAGGTTGPVPSPPGITPGSNSVFSTTTSAGGGRAGLAENSTPHPIHPGEAGGSGGGATGNGRSGTGGAGNTPPVSPPQGNPGGTSSGPAYISGSGGGGAGAAGTSTPGPRNPGGPGGAGTDVSPDFPAPLGGSPGGNYAGGGGGGANNDGPTSADGGTGGTGGGGRGGGQPGPAGQNTGVNGTANTGGGGGGGPTNGSCGTAAGTGGKGIVIIKYKFQ